MSEENREGGASEIWIKKFEDINIPIEFIQDLHQALAEVYGENLIGVFDYIPPEGFGDELSSFVEVHFTQKPDDMNDLTRLVDEHKAISHEI